MAEAITSSTPSSTGAVAGNQDAQSKRPVRSTASGPGQWVNINSNSLKKRKQPTSSKGLSTSSLKSTLPSSLDSASASASTAPADSEDAPTIDLVSDTAQETPRKKKNKPNTNKGAFPHHAVAFLHVRSDTFITFSKLCPTTRRRRRCQFGWGVHRCG